MKKQVIIALALFVSVFTFAQKKEVKALEKAVKKDNYAEAKALATQLDSQVSAMDDNLKEDYYLAAAQAYYANGTSNNVDTKKAIENVLSLIPHLRAHETKANLVCRLLLEKKKKRKKKKKKKKKIKNKVKRKKTSKATGG